MSVLDVSGILWVWGSNKKGELGLGDCTARPNPYPLLTLKEKELTHVKTGHYFAIAYSAKGVNEFYRSKSEVDALLGLTTFQSKSK